MQRPRAVGVGIVGIEIVDQDQVEVGRRRHLAAAELAHGDDRGFLPLDAAVLRGKLVADQAVHRLHDAFGDVGEGGAGMLGGNSAGQNPRADQEQALLAEQPQAIEKLLVGIRILQRRRQSLRQFPPVRHRAEETRIDQSVHQLRLARQHVAEPRRGAEDQRHQRHQIAVLAEQRDETAAALQRLQELVESHHRIVGLLGAGQSLDQRRHEFLEGPPRGIDLQHAIVAGHPLLHDGRHHQRLLEAQLGEIIEHARIVRAGPIIQVGELRRAGRIALEQPAVVALHAIEPDQQIPGEGGPVRIAEEARELLHPFGRVGQRMGLLVGDHLEPVLDPAQEQIGIDQFVADLDRDPVVGREHVERLQRRPHPQFGMPPARDQLLGLGEELDLADAATPDLDVVALDRNLALSAKRLHLALHVVDIGERREVEMLAPDERRDIAEQRLARRGIARAGPRLDHRGALPGAALALVIIERRRGGDRDLGGGGIGTQAQVDAEHVAVGGALLQHPRQALRHAHEERLRLDIRRQRRRIEIEEHDQVDIAGIVQFACAHLAHGEDDEPAALFRPLGIGRHDLAALRLLPKQEAQGALHGGDGDLGQRLGDPHHRPDSADVAQGDHQRRLALEPAQPVHRLVLVGGAGHVGDRPDDQRREMPVRIAAEQPHQAIRIGAHQVEQVRGRFRDAIEHRARHGKGVRGLANGGGLRRRQLRQPVVEALPRLGRREQNRAGHDSRCQRFLAGVAFRG